MLGLEILGSGRIGNRVWCKSAPLVLDDHGHPFTQFTSAMNLNELAGIKTVAVNDRIVESLPKGEFNGELLADNVMRFFDQANHLVHER
ncbi:MAG: hypothetical protein WBC04_00930 [Candidatus Acidiferrales bacterium]